MKQYNITKYMQQHHSYQQQLQDVEQEIATLEEDYLSRTLPYGNILTGFNTYLVNKKVHKNKSRAIVPSEYRLFSLSSITSPIKFNRSFTSQKKPNITSRMTRNTFRNQMVKEERPSKDQIIPEQPKQKSQSWDLFTVTGSLNRYGSYHRNPRCKREACKRFQSDGPIDRTLSIGSHFYSAKTDSLNQQKIQKIKKRRAQSDNLSAPSLKKRRKRSQSTKKQSSNTRVNMVAEQLPEQTQSMQDLKNESIRQSEQMIAQQKPNPFSALFYQNNEQSDDDQEGINYLLSLVRKKSE